MTCFNRQAYIDTLRPLYLELCRAARDQGCAIGNGDRDGNLKALNEAVDAAQQAFIDAMYALPVELDGTKLTGRAA